jgi:hypothetical protein
MTDELFSSAPFAQIRGQMDFTYDGEPLWSPDTVAEGVSDDGPEERRLMYWTEPAAGES